jgi:hypothetical protein
VGSGENSAATYMQTIRTKIIRTYIQRASRVIIWRPRQELGNTSSEKCFIVNVWYSSRTLNYTDHSDNNKIIQAFYGLKHKVNKKETILCRLQGVPKVLPLLYSQSAYCADLQGSI